MTLGFAVLTIDLFSGRSDANPSRYAALLLMLSFFPLTLLSLLFGRRRKWVYYFAAVMLGLFVCRALYSSSLYVYWMLHKHPVSQPYFHLAERDKPLVVNQEMPVVQQMLVPLATGLLIWLFVRFTFGRPSRNHFGFEGKSKLLQVDASATSNPPPTPPA